MPENTQEPNREPLLKLKSEGAVRAAVWANTREATQEEYHTVSFYRTYKDRSGEFKTTTSFRPQDLPFVAELAHKVEQLLTLERAQRNHGPRASGPAPGPAAAPHCEPDAGP